MKKMTMVNVLFHLVLLSLLVPIESKPGLQLAAIGPAAIALGTSAGASLLKGLFGRRKPQLSHEQRIARQQYIDMINNQGYAAGEKSAITAQLNRNLGADLGLQGALQNERLVGMGGTAFADAQRNQLAQAYANAQSQGLANIDIAGQNRAFQATQALSGLRPTEMSKSNFFDVIGDVGEAIMPIAAQQLGKGPKPPIDSNIVNSSKEFKTDIQPTDTKQLLDAVDNLNVRTYRYKPGIEDGGVQQRVGLISEEAPPMLQSPDGKGIDMQNLVMTMLGALQGLSKEISLVRQFVGAVKEIRKIEKQYA